MDSADSGLELRENPRTPSPGAEVGGEVDEALSMFWYRNLLRAGTDVPEVDPDWGYCMSRLTHWLNGLQELPLQWKEMVWPMHPLSLDLAFIFGLTTVFPSLCGCANQFAYDALHASGQPMPDLRSNQHNHCEKLHEIRNQPQWWFAIEEALANAHVARDPQDCVERGFPTLRNVATALGWISRSMGPMGTVGHGCKCIFFAVIHAVVATPYGEIDPLGILLKLKWTLRKGHGCCIQSDHRPSH